MLRPIHLCARVLVALAILVPCANVHASGLYLFDRGARPLSRGGAFVAGADDPSSLWYNPAGLADSGDQILSDLTLTLMFASFERMNLDPTTGEVLYRHPKVDAKPTPLPIPTLAMSHDFGLEDFTFGFGILAPNAVLLNWEQSVNGPTGPQASPTRYSLKGIKGTIVANAAAGLAWHGIDGLSIGADVQLVVGAFKVEQALSSCDGFMCTNPEAFDYDANATLELFPTYAVTGVFGITYDMKLLRLGASAMLPYQLKGEATLDVDVPSAPIFRNARVIGDKADVAIDFPTIVRVGSELRLTKSLRLESAFVWEQWSRQKKVSVTPKNMRIENVEAISDYEIGPVTLERNLKDAWSVRGGYEFFVPRSWTPWGIKLVMRGGMAYEKGAFTSANMTPFTLDSDKFVLSGGFGVNLFKRLRMDTVLTWISMKNMQVRDSQIRQPQAIRPNDVAAATALGNGDYVMEALVLGGGLVYDLD